MMENESHKEGKEPEEYPNQAIIMLLRQMFEKHKGKLALTT